MTRNNARCELAGKTAILLAALLCNGCFAGRENVVLLESKSRLFPVVLNGGAVDIVIDKGDAEVVKIAADAVCHDIEMVTGVLPKVTNTISNGGNVIIAGTYGKNAWVDKLAKSGKLNCSHIDSGQWESFIIAVVDKPFDGVDKALVVAGSDRRGTAYGLFELSKEFGVSPWVWWADVTPEKKIEIAISSEFRKFGPPSVKYRGIFLNDEGWSLHPWAAKNFDKELGDIGPKTYERIFKLMLRLKLNYIWPAMHPCTKAFNLYPENKIVADKHAIVMGSSHCEPMLRNNITEWKGYGQWDPFINLKGLSDYWTKRLIENGQYENIYTVGMRGIGDGPMPPKTKTDDDRTKMTQRIIELQRELLTRHVGGPVENIPQLFCPYKEVLDYYNNGMDVPEDITLLWADNNFGYIRQFSTPAEQKRSGGAGVYYHVGYYGSPTSYLWINHTAPSVIWEEMSKAYDYNARKVWIVNVNDLKFNEIAVDFWAQLSWDVTKWKSNAQKVYLRQFATQNFGGPLASDIAELLDDYFALVHQRFPGTYDRNKELWELSYDPLGWRYPLFVRGDAAARRIEKSWQLQKRAETIYKQLPEHQRDGFYELVLYPVRGAALLDQKFFHAWRSRVYAEQGRVSANRYAMLASKAWEQLQKDKAYFNEELAGGKWTGMLDVWPWPNRGLFRDPETKTVKPLPVAVLDVILEGQICPIGQKDISMPFVTDVKQRPIDCLPTFHTAVPGQRFFVDLYNRGDKPIDWKAAANQPWIQISETAGRFEEETRLWVSIAPTKAPAKKELSGTLTITGGGRSYNVDLRLLNPPINAEDIGGRPVLATQPLIVPAANFANSSSTQKAQWRPIESMGDSGKTMAVFPTTAGPFDNTNGTDEAPSMTYSIYSAIRGKVRLSLQAMPTHRIHKGRGLRCSVSIDDKPAAIMEFLQGGHSGDPLTDVNIMRGAMYAHEEIDLGIEVHRVIITAVDTGVILDRLIFEPISDK